MEAQRAPSAGLFLLLRSRSKVCLLPLTDVSETMRCLPIQPVPSAPPFVKGVSVIRGEPVPVVDLGLVLGEDEAPEPRRLVTLRVGGRAVALSVEEVLRIVPESATNPQELPPLLRGAAEGTVRELRLLDNRLLSVLEAARFLPEEGWSPGAPAGAAS